MKAEAFFPEALCDYIQAITSPESPLLSQLRLETEQVLGQIQMLTGPVEGHLLKWLVQLSGANRILELGTFSGYSALWMAQGLPSDGSLVTCEIRPENAQLAQKYFDQSPDGHKIQLLLGDALETVPTLTGEFDFIFLDANQAKYPAFYELILSKLSAKGLLVVDNALWGGEVTAPNNKYAQAIDEFNRKARQDPRVETLLLSVRDGMLLIRKR